MQIKRDRQNRVLGQKFYNDKNLNHEEVGDLTFNTSSESFVDVTGSELSIYFEKDTSVLILIFGQIQPDTANYTAYMQLVIDDVAEPPEVKSTELGEAEVVTAHFVKDLEKGTHVFKLQTKIDDSAAIANLSQGSITVINLSEK